MIPLPVLLSYDKDGYEMKHDIACVAVDEENNVYLAVHYYGYNNSIVLYVFDEHCNNVKHKSKLKFRLAVVISYLPFLAVTKNKDIVMKNENVYICDVTGQLKYEFEPNCWDNVIGLSENNEIIMGTKKGYIVEIYTEERNLKSTIKLPEGHKVIGVAFHFGLSKIIVLSQENDKFYLYLCSETDEEHKSTFLGKKYMQFSFRIISHPRGPAAVVTENAILYL